MFESWLQLDHRPFGTAPFAAHYFAASAIDASRASIHRCIERGAGPAVVIGGAGTGKTMLALVLQHEVCPLTPLALVSGGEMHSRRELLQSILYEFGLPYRGQQETELRLTLLDFVTSRDASQLASVLLVDDADCLTPELLHDLASLSNHVRDGNWCLQLVLLGTLRLEELLASPSLASLQQRIAGRCQLADWTQSETIAYIRGQVAPLQEKWGQFPQFPEDTCRKIHAITSGTPRLVNQLCEHLLMSVLVTGTSQVAPEEAERAWYDLQQLPPPDRPAHTAASQASPPADEDLIEFGELGDDDHAVTASHRSSDVQWQLEQLESGLQRMLCGDTPDGDAVAANHPRRNAVPSEVANPFDEKFAEEWVLRDHDVRGDFPIVEEIPVPLPTGPDPSNRSPGNEVLGRPEPERPAWNGDATTGPRRYRHLFSRLVQGA